VILREKQAELEEVAELELDSDVTLEKRVEPEVIVPLLSPSEVSRYGFDFVL
jgi:hypothetical protein